jgi:hypothetical protein
MWPIAGLGLAAVVPVTMGLGTRSWDLALRALARSAIVMLLGVGCPMSGRMKTDEAIAMVDPRDAEHI